MGETPAQADAQAAVPVIGEVAAQRVARVAGRAVQSAAARGGRDGGGAAGSQSTAARGTTRVIRAMAMPARSPRPSASGSGLVVSPVAAAGRSVPGRGLRPGLSGSSAAAVAAAVGAAAAGRAAGSGGVSDGQAGRERLWSMVGGRRSEPPNSFVQESRPCCQPGPVFAADQLRCAQMMAAVPGVGRAAMQALPPSGGRAATNPALGGAPAWCRRADRHPGG